MRHLGLLAILCLSIIPVNNLSAIPLLHLMSTAAQYVAMQNGRLSSTRTYFAIESLHVAAGSRVGIAEKVLCIVAQSPWKKGHIHDKTTC